MNPSMVHILGPNLLTEVKSVLPDVKVSLAEERSQMLLIALERRQLDVAIIYNVEDRPDLSRQALLEEDLLFLTAASKSKAARRRSTSPRFSRAILPSAASAASSGRLSRPRRAGSH